jgi:hypothetical protein
LRCRKKRMPSCNEADTGLNVTRHESEPTSDGCFVAREHGELPVGGKANDDDGSAVDRCALHLKGKVASREYREGGWVAKIRSPGQLRSWLLKGLSRMKGNFHVRFLGGPWAGNSPGLPGYGVMSAQTH